MLLPHLIFHLMLFASHDNDGELMIILEYGSMFKEFIGVAATMPPYGIRCGFAGGGAGNRY